tara:strand:- start:417 stop:701 length:285 start_codon:yes stop_codon:yes gene_type:complete
MLSNLRTIDCGWCTILQAQKGEEVIPLAMLYSETDPEHPTLWMNANTKSPQAKEAQQEFFEKYYVDCLVDELHERDYIPVSEMMELCGGELKQS